MVPRQPAAQQSIRLIFAHHVDAIRPRGVYANYSEPYPRRHVGPERFFVINMFILMVTIKGAGPESIRGKR